MSVLTRSRWWLLAAGIVVGLVALGGALIGQCSQLTSAGSQPTCTPALAPGVTLPLGLVALLLIALAGAGFLRRPVSRDETVGAAG